jgi:biotin carboxyl carrier protein
MSIAASPQPRRRARWLALLVGAVLIAALALPVAWRWRELWRWASGLRSGQPATGADAPANDELAGHDHGAHGESNSLQLSRQARESLGVKTAKVALEPYYETILVPGIVVERPGRSRLEVGAPLTGIVTEVVPVEGEALTPGQRLFRLRMTHEELVQSQAEFLRLTEELDVVRQEVDRLQGLADRGAIAGKTLLERRYEEQKLAAVLRAQRQALLLHGLSEEQVNEIARSHELVQEMTVYAPEAAAASSAGEPERVYTVQRLAVQPGQQVDAGATLCVLADHSELHIEGRVFEREMGLLERSAQQGWKLKALPAGSDVEGAVEGLEVLYVADQVDVDTRTLRFYVRLPNVQTRTTAEHEHRFVEWRFKPGQRLQLELPVEEYLKRIVLPPAAVVRDGVEHYVFLQNGDRFDRKPVHVEHRDARAVVLANDGSIFPGDRVVTSGAQQMQLALKARAAPPVDPHAGHNH